MAVSNLPAIHDGRRRYCLAKKHQGGGQCHQAAGWGTDHPGQGRCKLHGGCCPIKHGLSRRWSTLKHVRLRELEEHHLEDDDPLNLLPDLATMRALFQDYIERYEEWSAALIAWHESYQRDNPEHPPKPVQVLDLADAYRILSEATKIVKRIEDVRAQSAISRQDLRRLMQDMAHVVAITVDKYLSDPIVCEQMKLEVRNGWWGIRLT